KAAQCKRGDDAVAGAINHANAYVLRASLNRRAAVGYVNLVGDWVDRHRDGTETHCNRGGGVGGAIDHGYSAAGLVDYVNLVSERIHRLRNVVASHCNRRSRVGSAIDHAHGAVDSPDVRAGVDYVN